MFTPIPGERIQFDDHISSIGLVKNQQLVLVFVQAISLFYTSPVTPSPTWKNVPRIVFNEDIKVSMIFWGVEGGSDVF